MRQRLKLIAGAFAICVVLCLINCSATADILIVKMKATDQDNIGTCTAPKLLPGQQDSVFVYAAVYDSATSAFVLRDSVWVPRGAVVQRVFNVPTGVYRVKEFQTKKNLAALGIYGCDTTVVRYSAKQLPWHPDAQ